MTLFLRYCLFFLLLISLPASAKKCTGSDNCTACTNCSGCAHCGAGGSCGVCASRSEGAFAHNSLQDTHEPVSSTYADEQQSIHSMDEYNTSAPIASSSSGGDDNTPRRSVNASNVNFYGQSDGEEDEGTWTAWPFVIGAAVVAYYFGSRKKGEG